MARGGKRPNAGRKTGSVDGISRVRQARQEIAKVIEARGILPEISAEIDALSPLQVMAVAYKWFAQNGHWEKALMAADKLAPYTAPKLSNITVSADVTVQSRELSMEELDAQLASLNIIDATIIDEDEDQPRTD